MGPGIVPESGLVPARTTPADPGGPAARDRADVAARTHRARHAALVCRERAARGVDAADGVASLDGGARGEDGERRHWAAVVTVRAERGVDADSRAASRAGGRFERSGAELTVHLAGGSHPPDVHLGRGLPSCGPWGRLGRSSHQRLQGMSPRRSGLSG
jgi:hypothetical protein